MKLFNMAKKRPKPEYFPVYIQTRWTGLFLFLVFLYCTTSLGYAGEGERILIINSSASTKKYAQAQSAFLSKTSMKWKGIDLGKDQLDLTRIKNTIKGKNTEIVYCIGSNAYRLAHKVAERKKIIFTSIFNWRRMPLGKNTYGISTELPAGMQLMMYRYLFPKLKKVGVIYSKHNKEWLKGAVEAANEVGIEIIAKSLKKPKHLESTLKETLLRVDALWLISDPIVMPNTEAVKYIFKQSKSMKKPVFAYKEVFTALGAVLVISAHIPTIGEQAGILAQELLDNEEITERVSSPASSHITLNLKKAEEYGIEVDEEALGTVNRVIK